MILWLWRLIVGHRHAWGTIDVREIRSEGRCVSLCYIQHCKRCGRYCRAVVHSDLP